ncbi:hypothetical protein LEP1GSC187_3791 [Leptospira santarosai str. ZUN179]|uniref:Uncharacterized protein n=1 Tax=Leptospira santarosai str. ZUN179 TaxID=1049985 RepID=M6V436_9LEPT|nr:hypothetical protein LEP1GSC187_3791 [Leptospira santarosai str. ZUN179]
MALCEAKMNDRTQQKAIPKGRLSKFRKRFAEFPNAPIEARLSFPERP